MKLSAKPIGEYTPEDQAFYRFWYGHMRNDMMQPPLTDVSHATARYVWDAALGQQEAGSPFTVSAALRMLIADDAYAMTFQTFGQYRTALLKAIDAATAAAAPSPTPPSMVGSNSERAIEKWLSKEGS